MPNYITDPDLLAQLDGGSPAPAASKSRTPEQFAKEYGPVAERAAKALNVSPQALLGQWGLETGWGKSIIPGTNNLGNIKDFAGGGVAATDNMNGSRDKYRSYASPDAFADDFVSLIQRKYPDAVGAKDPLAFANALKAGGYAEDPRYVDKVVQATRMAGSTTNPIVRAVGNAVESVIPSANAAERSAPAGSPGRQYISDPALLAELNGEPKQAQAVDEEAPVPRVEVRGTSADEPQITTGDRFRQGLVDPINGGAQLLTRMLPNSLVQAGNQFNNFVADKTGLVARLPEGGVDQQVRDQEAQYQAQRQAQGQQGVDWARLGGNVLSPANLGMAAAGPALAATRVGQLGAGAALGAGSGALMPVTSGNPEDFAREKGIQAGVGGVAGGVMQPVANAIGRLISPNAAQNAGNQLLRQEGVRPTIGQTLGGFANNVEQRLTSIPVLGDMISGARQGAQDDLRRAAQNRVTAPINAPAVRETGNEGVAAVSGAVDDAYAAARNAMGSFRLDQPALQNIQRVQQGVANLPRDQQNTFNSILRTVETDVSPNGTIAAENFKKIDSELNRNIAQFGKGGPYDQQLADALRELQSNIQQAGSRANPNAARLFQQADEAFANLVRVQDAAKRAAAQDGSFTPGQLTQAVRGSDQSARKNAVARGDALMQDLSSAGNRLSNTVPDSGTAGRTFAGIAALGSGAINPLIPLGIAGSSLAYTQPVQSLLRASVLNRPGFAEPVRNSLLQAAPALAPSAGQLALGYRK